MYLPRVKDDSNPYSPNNVHIDKITSDFSVDPEFVILAKNEINIPEKTLVIAQLLHVLNNVRKGLIDLQTIGRVREVSDFTPNMFAQDFGWIFSDDDYIHSYIYCCDILDLNPSFIRHFITSFDASRYSKHKRIRYKDHEDCLYDF